ncbi:hypothetical protein BOTBODRAFT_546723 [Botryobasidium botryosum FD-172 SS1]|uniref:NADP-dependent oxidoreductase domain-containing protein n=1 Tax=Botryobasidium botryosum (strain FD-172 SS1) TaxID=930990 RepID=A0A067MQJ5_BOTB1|nr:hypothetical protein BOTBODRAFT_546723 [Botryobasidium botryosum FD-172 SS1]
MKTANLGGTASNVLVGKIGHGLMMATWKPIPVPDEQIFEAMKTAVETAGPDAKMIFNSAEFYGINPPTANLSLINRFFTKYPEYADRVFLSVKGGINFQKRGPDSSEANLRLSVDNINKHLGSAKRMDLFECARVDPDIPIEETIAVLAQLIKEGKFDHIGLSECSAATLRRAHKVHPIAAVEIEVSLWSYEEETKKVIAAAEELGVAVIAYSPLGNGILTGKVGLDSLDKDDHRRHFDRFQEENLKHNQKILDALTNFAQRKGVTTAQLALAWVSSRGPHVIPLPGFSNVVRANENLQAADVEFTAEELGELDELLRSAEVKGGRYSSKMNAYLWG